ncbi:ABC transporter B family member 10-like [Magnolia sinica]|uniref:ABC transporter B family member 10-like n=1 Tax=Magnolia sinica TaxID=86752 RepID=UPI002657B2D7|nr:ABC transporter B family member 10-like [Magnolia sinica]
MISQKIKVGNFMHYISRFLAGFTIGFIRIWQISLVTLSIVPLIAIAGGIYAYIATGLIARVQKSYVKVREIAEEAIANVRTVQAFAGEEKAVKSYRDALQKTYTYGKKGGLAKGLGLMSFTATQLTKYRQKKPVPWKQWQSLATRRSLILTKVC